MAAVNILQEIVAGKRQELAVALQHTPAQTLQDQIAGLPPTRDFAAALRVPGAVRVIAEVKKASPSAGLIRPDFDAVAIATGYSAAGAAAISVLTDERWFQGKPEFLTAIRAAVPTPLLRKDFVVDAYQLIEARAWGADAALLIVAVLAPDELTALSAEAEALGLTALVEVHTAEETDLAVAAGARVLGINNRDLTVFQTNLETTFRLRDRIPSDRIVVSESGIRTPDDIVRLRAAGVDAVLVGEALMRVDDFTAATRALVDAGRG